MTPTAEKGQKVRSVGGGYFTVFREGEKNGVKVIDSFVQSLKGCCVHNDVLTEKKKRKKKKSVVKT